MKKMIIPATMLLLLLAFSGQGTAGISIGVNIPLPPVFVFSAPPELLVIPGTYVYYCPDVDFDIFFYGGYWYCPHAGYWYRSASYGGPWAYIERPPSVLISLPPNYRVITRGERRIPYAELHNNWRSWERGKYWEHQNWGRAEHERHYGAAPPYREKEHPGYQGAAPRSKERGPSEFHGGGRPEDRGRHENHERH